MPFPISLERDFETGLDRYVVVASAGFGPADASELCDWLAAAAQNPQATFKLDLTALDPGARALQTVLSRTAWLRSDRRVELVTPAAAAA